MAASATVSITARVHFQQQQFLEGGIAQLLWHGTSVFPVVPNSFLTDAGDRSVVLTFTNKFFRVGYLASIWILVSWSLR